MLLKDLSRRLLYGVKIFAKYADSVLGLHLENEDDYSYVYVSIPEVKPYLFPLSSMTEEQKKELHDKLIELELQALNDEISRIDVVEFEIDYYLKNHLDYHGLIEKGLATDASNLNIY